MHFNIVFIAAALLVSASPEMSVKITAFAGVGCTGSVIISEIGSSPGCTSFADGDLAKSFDYSGVIHQISFFESGGQNNGCTGTPFLVLGGGSGCETVPSGFHVGSISWS